MTPIVANKPKNNRGRRKAVSGTPTPPPVYKHKNPRLAFHLPQELLDAFARYVASLPGPPADSAILRGFMEEGLKRAGFWPPKGKQPPADAS